MMLWNWQNKTKNPQKNFDNSKGDWNQNLELHRTLAEMTQIGLVLHNTTQNCLSLNIICLTLISLYYFSSQTAVLNSIIKNGFFWYYFYACVSAQERGTVFLKKNLFYLMEEKGINRKLSTKTVISL